MQPFFCRLIPKPKIDPNNFVAPNAQNIKNTEVLETVPLLFGRKGFMPYIYTPLPKALVQIILILLGAWEYKIGSKIFAILRRLHMIIRLFFSQNI